MMETAFSRDTWVDGNPSFIHVKSGRHISDTFAKILPKLKLIYELHEAHAVALQYSAPLECDPLNFSSWLESLHILKDNGYASWEKINYCIIGCEPFSNGDGIPFNWDSDDHSYISPPQSSAKLVHALFPSLPHKYTTKDIAKEGVLFLNACSVNYSACSSYTSERLRSVWFEVAVDIIADLYVHNPDVNTVCLGRNARNVWKEAIAQTSETTGHFPLEALNGFRSYFQPSFVTGTFTETEFTLFGRVFQHQHLTTETTRSLKPSLKKNASNLSPYLVEWMKEARC